MTTPDWGQPNTRPPRNVPYFWLAVLAVVMVGAIGSGAMLFGPDLIGDGDASTTTEPELTDTEALQQGAETSLAAFADAMAAGDLAPLGYAGSTATMVVSDFEAVTAGLAPFTIAVETGPVTLAGDTAAQAPIELAWTIDERIEWATSSTVELELAEGEWLVRWEPSILEPSLVSGDELTRSRVGPVRGPVVGRDGTVLVDDAPVVQVGIRPSRVEDLGSLVRRLEELVGIDPDDLAARVGAAGPDDFVEVITLPADDYETVRPEIFPLPGTVFREGTQPVSLGENFARALLGRSGEATAEIIEEYPGLFEPGDIAGLSGMQATFNEALAGQPGAEISVVRAPIVSGSTTTGTGLTTTSAVRRANQAEVLATIEPAEGEPLVTTIEPAVQIAAEDALAAEGRTSSLVAIEVSSGDILAVANGPTGSTVNFAMTGQYPPGSIAKVVTGYALLRDRLDIDTPVDCPETITVEGRTFSNVEGERLGTFPFLTAFALSCNTAFVGESLDFSPETLTETAAEFGLGVDYQMGEPAFSGSVPEADSRVDLAATSFGQGQVLYSPLSAAVMAATAADGVYRSPRLVVSPEQAPQDVVELEPGPAAALQEVMRAVVTGGTGTAVAGVPGPPVHGKTGTAEFGNQVPPETHAWFVGFQGDIAFAVFVEGGNFGGGTAAPIAGRFLTTLQQQGVGGGDDETTTTTATDDQSDPDETSETSETSEPPDDDDEN
jgi:cell division protein FtsI/penicillin-binding protein 2